jgi:hypothetical protein
MKLKIVVPVADLAHVPVTVQNLSKLFPHENVDVEIQVVNVSLFPADQHGQIITALSEIQHTLKEIKMTQQEVTDLLNKIDGVTNKTAANVQTIADVDQKISDEIDAFLAAVPAGTVLTDANVAQLQAIADRAQATSDASDAQVAVLQAIAAKGAPAVPPPPPPVVV